MTKNEARKIKVGDRVVYSDGVEGECVEIGYCLCKFSWKDGQIGCLDHNDMQDVSRLKKQAA